MTWHPDLCGGSAPSCGPSCLDLTVIDRPLCLYAERLQPDSPGPPAGPHGGPRRPDLCAAGPDSARWPGGHWDPEGAGEWGAVGGSAAGRGAEDGPQLRTGYAPGWRRRRGMRPRNWAETQTQKLNTSYWTVQKTKSRRSNPCNFQHIIQTLHKSVLKMVERMKKNWYSYV